MKNVAAAVAFRNNRILLARRAPGQELAGYWEFPGGKLESGETLGECIEREMDEEFGIQVKAGDVLADSVFHYPGGAIHLFAIEVEMVLGVPQLRVHDAIEWVELSKIEGVTLCPADIDIAAKLTKHYSKSTN